MSDSSGQEKQRQGNDPTVDVQDDLEKVKVPNVVPLATPVFPEGGWTAWGVVIGCWCAAFASFGMVNSFGVYQTYYKQTFLQNRSIDAIAWIGSIQTFAQFSAALASGPLTDRYGPMIVVRPFSLLLVIAMMLTSLCKEYYQFILCQGILLGVSCGLIFAPALAVIGQYFFRKRPLAMSLASTGSPIGGIIYPVVLNNLLPAVGFGWAQRTCGFISLVLLALAVLLIRPTGITRKNKLLLPEAFKKAEYSLQVAGLFMIVLGIWTPYFYIAQYGLEHGMSESLATYLFALLNGGSFIGRVSGGFLSGAFGQFNVITAASFASSILIFCWFAMSTPGALIALALLFGGTSGMIISLMMSTIAHTADHPSKIGTYIGQSTFFIGITALAGPPASGALISAYGFNACIAFSATVIMVGAVLISGARYTFAPNKLKA